MIIIAIGTRLYVAFLRSRKKIRSGSRQQEDSEDADTPRKKPRRSRAAAEESYQEETKEEGEASD